MHTIASACSVLADRLCPWRRAIGARQALSPSLRSFQDFPDAHFVRTFAHWVSTNRHGQFEVFTPFSCTQGRTSQLTLPTR
jgi:hypothetical protein